MVRVVRRLLWVALVAATPSLPAQEAYLPPAPERSTIWGERIDRALQETASNPTLNAVLTGAVPAPGQWRHEFAATDFTPAGERDVPERLAGNLAREDQRLKSLKLGREILAGVESSPGFRRNNFAYALTAAISASLRLTDLRSFDAQQEQRLLRIVNDALGESPTFRRSTPAERTLAYDALIVTAGMITRMTDDAIANDDRELAGFALTLARETLASLGIRR